MAKKEKEYRRLPGKGLRRQGNWIAVTRTNSTLWLGKDHLLCVDSLGGYSEDYKRFYYRDIQAIITRETDSWRNGNLIFGIGSVLVTLVAWMTSSGVVLGFWLGLAGFLFILLLINLLRGRTCACHLRTAVQTEHLPSLKRLRTARKAIALLKPLIEEAQGTIPPEQFSSRLQELVARQAASDGAAATATPRASVTSAGPAVAPYLGAVHLVLFGVLLLDSAHTGLNFFVRGAAMTVLSILLWAGIAFSLVLSLIKQQGALTAGLRRVTWGILGYVLVAFAISYVQMIAVSIQNAGPKRVMTQWDMIKVQAETSPFDSAWVMGTMIFSLTFSLGLGLVGLLLLRRFRQEDAAQPSPVPQRREVPARQNQNEG
ncbi:MAG TPA: hypothetical protein VEL06_14135 [Haliangiales bacterium]|nr:hypothetical protein [Haliangiales bacterium]